jgi:hypothetical protein
MSMVAPIQTPQNSERITSLVMSAMEMANNGGIREEKETRKSVTLPVGTNNSHTTSAINTTIREIFRVCPFTKGVNIGGELPEEK